MTPNSTYDIGTWTWTPDYMGMSNGDSQWDSQWDFQWKCQWVYKWVFPMDYREWNETLVNVDL
jgi:hypothetical protein